jgi:hypothetical protein
VLLRKAARLHGGISRSAAGFRGLQFHNILIYVLLGAAVVTALLDHWTDTAVILAVVVVNAIIGVIQEGKAEKAMEAIRRMLAPRAAVLRDGAADGGRRGPGARRYRAAGGRRQGARRPAPVAHAGLQVQEAILTGESVPVEKQTSSRSPPTRNSGDRLCMASFGTLVTAGQAAGRGRRDGCGDRDRAHQRHAVAGRGALTTPLVRRCTCSRAG